MMKAYLPFAMLFLLFPASAATQPATCPKTEESVRTFLRQVVEARERGGIVAASKFYADDIVISADDGKVFDRAGYVAMISKEQEDNDERLGGQPDEISVKFVGDLAILTYIDKLDNTERNIGARTFGTFRESRVLMCQEGEWKVIFRSEIQRPNANRAPVESERAKFDDYVGRYRVVQNGKALGDITITRKGDKLFEAWGKEPASEILPGGHDSFFVRGDNTTEYFLRDKQNRVIGIHYIVFDDHFEATRLD